MQPSADSIGKTSRNAACRPSSLRSSGSTPSCMKSRNEFVCISSSVRKGHRLRDLAELDLFHARSPLSRLILRRTASDKQTKRRGPPLLSRAAVSPYVIYRESGIT